MSSALLELRGHHRSWGAGKLLKILGWREPGWKLAAIDGVRASQACGLGTAASAERAAWASWSLAERDGRAEHGVVCGLQGAVQDSRRAVLLSADGVGRLQLLPAGMPGTAFDVGGAGQASTCAVVRGVIVDYPDGQRSTLRDQCAGATVAAVGVVDPAGDLPGADQAGLSGAERAARADIQDAEGGGHAAACGERGLTAGPLRPFSSRVHRGAAAGSAGTGSTGVSVHGIGSAVSRGTAGGVVPGSLRDARRQRERRDSLEVRLGERDDSRYTSGSVSRRLAMGCGTYTSAG